MLHFTEIQNVDAVKETNHTPTHTITTVSGICLGQITKNKLGWYYYYSTPTEDSTLTSGELFIIANYIVTLNKGGV